MVAEVIQSGNRGQEHHKSSAKIQYTLRNPCLTAHLCLIKTLALPGNLSQVSEIHLISRTTRTALVSPGLQRPDYRVLRYQAERCYFPNRLE